MLYLKFFGGVALTIALLNALAFIFDIIFSIPVLNWIVGIGLLGAFMLIGIYSLFKLLEVIEGKN